LPGASRRPEGAPILFAAIAPAAIVTPAPAGAGWNTERVAALQRDLNALVSGSAAVRGAHVGIVAVDANSGATLYARNADDEFQPASTLKLLVGSAALERLGPDYRFVTTAAIRAYAGGALPHDAVAVLTAGGDPFLDAAALDDAVAALVAAGVNPFGWQADVSRYDVAPYPDGWTWDDFGEDYAAPLSALTFEENVLHLTVTPGANQGDPPSIASAPIPYYAPVERMCNGFTPVTADARTGPPGSESTLDVVRPLGRCTNLIGAIARGAAPESIDATVVLPDIYALAYLEFAGRRAGLDPERARRDGSAGSVTAGVFWTHASGPLRTWLGPRFWIPSDNLVAELLLKELGFVTGGKPGTTAKGIAFEKTWLRGIGVDPATVTLADGSGLSQYDRITPRDLVAVLAHDWASPNRELILGSLPVGGARGSIEGIAGTGAAGRVFAKTGSMSHVRGLAGYLAPLHHGAVIFAFSVDDWNGAYPALAALRAAVLARLIDD
jgi:D-alanyl-D-alanine carboxypeptidase/D-alanyl-D-alanine-endopeptidase (penicillin-binding protein 4)